MTSRSLLHIAGLLILSYSAWAQTVDLTFYTKADGLLENSVFNIQQARDGYIWLANGSRILRFDGRNFVEFPKSEDILENTERLYGIGAYQDSLLYIATNDKLILANPRSAELTFYPFPLPPPYSLKYVTTDNFDNLLLSFTDENLRNQLWQFRNGQFKLIAFPSDQISGPYHFWSIDEQGNFRFSLPGEIRLFDSLGTYKRSIDLSTEVGEQYSCWPLVSREAGWATTLAHGLFYNIDFSTGQIVPHSINRHLKGRSGALLQFIFDESGDIWACGSNKTLLHYQVATDELHDYSEELDELIPNNCDLIEIFQKDEGVIWISSALGILKVVKLNSPFKVYLDERDEHNNAYSLRGITEDEEGHIYAATYNGIFKIDPQEQTSERTTLNLHDPFHLLADSSLIWLNSGNAWDWKKGQLLDIPGSNPMWRDHGILAPDEHDQIWWLYEQLYVKSRTSSEETSWKLAAILNQDAPSAGDALHIGSQSKTIWMGYGKVLLQYAPQTDSLKTFSRDDLGLPFSQIMAIQERQNGSLWLATDIGLVSFDPASGSTQLYQASDGLPDNFICGLLTEGDSALWLGTNNGLSRFDIQTESFANFFEKDGLPGNEFNRISYLKASDGKMYFGGLNGLVAFSPAEAMRSYQQSAKNAHILLTNFEKTDDRRNTVVQRINFPRSTSLHIYHWDRSFTFTYALTDYADPGQTSYSYQMEGFENSWSDPSSLNSARYNNLPAGKYTFRVRARDRRGIWHPDELRVQVVVHPPWWTTPGMQLLYFLMAGVGIWIFIWRRTLSIQARNLQLERTVADRTAELEKQKQRAEQSEKYKEQFLANMSHEIRTPMNAISGMVRILLRNPLLPHQERFLGAIHTSSDNLLVILNDILDLSKIEAGKVKIQSNPINLREVIKAVTDILHFKAEEKSLALETIIPENVPLNIMGDATRIVQVLNNLVGNAIKFTEKGRIKLTLAVKDEKIHFRVSDTGMGIPQSKLSSVFESFEQINTGNTRAHGGTGLGLSITRQLVQLMGGTIDVESELGKGSTFTVVLPYQPVDGQEENHSSGSTQHALLDMGRQMSGLDVLLVDDNEFNLMLAQDDLQYFIPDIQITTASNGHRAIIAARQHRFDLILMDVQMPEMNGLDATLEIRQLEREDSKPPPPIIAMTASLLDREIQDCYKAGMVDYVPKPYQLDEFIPVIYRVWKASKAGVEKFV